MKRIIALVLATGVLMGAVPAGLTTTERYLAYRVRIERGESGYAMTALLTRIARARAREIDDRFRHDFRTYWRLGLTCTAGEIIAWSVEPDGRAAVRWAIAGWLASPIHRPFLENDGRKWRHYGVGAYRAKGRWWLVVSFSRC